jgi:hypothetical protein
MKAVHHQVRRRGLQVLSRVVEHAHERHLGWSMLLSARYSSAQREQFPLIETSPLRIIAVA